MRKYYFLFFVAMFFAGMSAFATGNPRGKTPPGERPPIDLRSVTDDAYEPGVIHVKFKPVVERNLQRTLIDRGQADFVTINLPAVDNLNRQFNVSQYKGLMHGIYQTRGASGQFVRRHRAHGLHLWFEIRLGHGVGVLNAVQAFSRLPEVEIAEPVYKKVLIEPASVSPVTRGDNQEIVPYGEWSPDDQFYGLQWGFKNTGQDIRGTYGTPGADIKAEQAWNTLKGNPEVIVAVIDEGIQYTHPDLQVNIWPGIGPEGTSTTPGDHGTHVAGTIAAVSNNTIGVAGAAGGDGTPGTGVKLMSLDIFNGSHGMNNLGINIYAADNGAAISQNSWGYRNSGVYNQSDLDGIDYFNAYGGGDILVGGLTIFAAGNSNSSANWYPAYYSGTVAVASTDNRDKKSSFSNYGSWIDLSAPGTDIASTGSGNSYLWMSGTSMACPHVSGVAALVLSYVPGRMTNQQLWDLLKATTDNIDANNSGFAGMLGTGRLNAFNAVEAAAEFLDGVNPPESFAAASVSESEIALTWQGNTANDPVLVAWSSTGTFGTPADEATYATGGTLPGGGKVLYYGSEATSLNHNGLDFTTTYYYRAWSYDGVKQKYSRHRAAQATTFCPDAWELPFAEDFNSGATLPLCWSTTGSASWSVGTFSGGLTGTGNYAWVEISGNAARTARLSTPVFDFSNVSDVRLEFIHRYNHNGSAAVLAYSLNNGSSWTALHSWSANSTTPFNQVITALAGKSNVQFSWLLDFPGGGPPVRTRSWSVDDISISGTISGNIYTITATAGAGGSISPSGAVTVNEGGSQAFTITPSAGYKIADVLVDEESVGAVTNYTFFNVLDNHTIQASFKPATVTYYTIEASAGPGGKITPEGNVQVQAGESQEFLIAANDGFLIADVRVNDGSVGTVSSFTFTDVKADQFIEAIFEAVSDDPCLITSLPYLQDFDAVAAIPECWSTVASAGNIIWKAGIVRGGLNTTGNYAYAVIKGKSAMWSELISAPFDLTAYPHVTLSFDHYYIHDRSTASVSYSTDNGVTWTEIASWSSTTGNPVKESFDIGAIAGDASNVLFKWELDYTGGSSANSTRSWFVDNVEVSVASEKQAYLKRGDPAGTLAPDIEAGLLVNVYPNPTRGKVNMVMNLDLKRALVTLTDVTGRALLKSEFFSIREGSPVALDISGLQPGLYLVNVAGDGFMSGQRIVLQK